MWAMLQCLAPFAAFSDRRYGQFQLATRSGAFHGAAVADLAETEARAPGSLRAWAGSIPQAQDFVRLVRIRGYEQRELPSMRPD